MTTHQQIVDAIRTIKRLGSRVPITLTRHLRTLERYAQWQRKAKLAATKLKLYRRKLKHYEGKNTL